MKSRRVGLTRTHDFPYVAYTYSFIPGHNETLRVWHPDGTMLLMIDLPADIHAEINISMGQAGLSYCNMRWWRRWKLDIAAWWDQLFN